MELSSKKPVSFMRTSLVVKKHKGRDPRFDDMSGDLKPHLFDKSYAFLDELKTDELKDLKKANRKVKNKEEKEKLKRVIDRYVRI